MKIQTFVILASSTDKEKIIICTEHYERRRQREEKQWNVKKIEGIEANMGTEIQIARRFLL